MLYNHSIDLQNGGYPVKKQAMTLLLAAVSLLGENGKDVRGWLAARALPIRWAAMLGGTIAVLLLGVWGSGFSEASFIYFNF